MLRIFGHFVPLPALALGLSEVLLLAIAFYLVNEPAAALQLRLISLPARMSIGGASLVVLAMVAVGLYHHDVFLDPRLMAIKAVTALLLVLPVAAAVGLVLSHEAIEGVRDGWTMWCVKASFVWMLSVLLTRTLFLRCADSDLFRRPVVVLGTGVRAGHIAALTERGAQRAFAAKGYVHACGDLRVIMGAPLDLDRTDDDRALAGYARDVGAREVVVATDERRGMPVLQLLHCKLAGINVIDYLTFFERETRKVELEALQPSWLIFSDGFRQGQLIDAAKRGFDIAVSLALHRLHPAGHGIDGARDLARRWQAGVLPAGAGRTRRQDLHAAQIPQHARRRRGRGRAAMGAERRPAHHPLRRHAAQVPHRRAAAAPQRAARRHELRRAAAGAAVLRRRARRAAFRSIASATRSSRASPAGRR